VGAYVETIPRHRRKSSTRGGTLARDEIVRRYVGPDYGWMWPFPRRVRAWFRQVIVELETQATVAKLRI